MTPREQLRMMEATMADIEADDLREQGYRSPGHKAQVEHIEAASERGQNGRTTGNNPDA